MELKESWMGIEENPYGGIKGAGWDHVVINWFLLFSTIILTFEETKHFCWPLWGAHGSHAEEEEGSHEDSHGDEDDHDDTEEVEEEW